MRYMGVRVDNSISQPETPFLDGMTKKETHLVSVEIFGPNYELL